MQTLTFCYLGITVTLSCFSRFGYRYDVPLIICTVLVCLIARAAHVFTFSPLLNLGRKRKIPIKMQVVMW